MTNEFAAVLNDRTVPVVGMDQEGLITFLNDAFENSYGWTSQDAVGKQLASVIIPPYMRDAHRIGFSRFLTTGQPTLLGKPLKLPIQCKDGRILNVEHIIFAEKEGERWRFAARILPTPA